MKFKLSALNSAALAVFLCSCATTSVEKTWKSPASPPGPVHKVAILAVSDVPPVRPALENRFARAFEARGQAVLTTVELLTLPQIKEDKAAATTRLRQEGADSILVVRLVDKATYDRQVRATPAAFVPVTAGYGGYGWYDYYSVAFMEMGVTYGSTRDYLILDSSLFDLNTGQRLWSGLTRTVLKEDADRLVVADDLVDKITAALQKDGLIR